MIFGMMIQRTMKLYLREGHTYVYQFQIFNSIFTSNFYSDLENIPILLYHVRSDSILSMFVTLYVRPIFNDHFMDIIVLV